jgi:hypothetical protein
MGDTIMGGKNKFDTKQLRADLETLSAFDFEIKYPGLSRKTLKGLTSVELEQRISKQSTPRF